MKVATPHGSNQRRLSVFAGAVSRRTLQDLFGVVMVDVLIRQSIHHPGGYMMTWLSFIMFLYAIISPMLYVRSRLFLSSGKKSTAVDANTSRPLRRLSWSGPVFALLFAGVWLPTSRPPTPFAVLCLPLLLVCADIVQMYCDAAVELSLPDTPNTLSAQLLSWVLMFVAYFLLELRARVALTSVAVGFIPMNARAVMILTAVFGGLGLWRWGRCSNLTADLPAFVPALWKRNHRSEAFQQLRRTLRRPSMRAALVLWSTQGFCTGLTRGFFAIFMMLVCSTSLSPLTRAVVLVITQALPSVTASAIQLLLNPTSRQWKKSVAYLLAGRCVASVVIFIVWRVLLIHEFSSGEVANVERAIFAVGLGGVRILTDLISWHQEFIMADLADEDVIMFGHPPALTTRFHRALGAVAKPFEVLAISLTCGWCFCGDYLSSLAEQHAPPLALQSRIMVWVSGWSMALSVLTLWCWWSWYTLEGKHLQFIRSKVNTRTTAEAAEAI